MPQPPVVEQAAEELIRVYTQAWEAITAEQQALLGDTSRARRRRRLRELQRAVERELAALGAPARDWIRRRLPEVYQAGAGALEWNQLHRSAVQQLATDTFNDLLRATEYVRSDVKRFVREAGKFFSEQTLATGRTAQQAGRDLARFLEERGLAAITYRNGARHGLADYADTVLRTKTAVAYNEGAINTATERGFTTFEIFDGPGCGIEGHAVGAEANGMVVDEATARAWPIAHPRCQRAFSARPDLVAPTSTRPTRTLAAVTAAAIAAGRQPRSERQPRQPRRPRAQAQNEEA